MTGVFDSTSALARLGGDRGLLKALVLFFEEDSPALQKQIRSAVESGDAPEVERVAHSLIGLVASFSADGARDAVERVAHSARAGDLSAASERLAELEHQFERLRKALRSYVAELGS